MIKTPLSTVIGGAFWTPGATVINGAKLSFEIVMKKLFANSEQGFYQDPYDLGVMFQDAAGTTAVNATGQPLGLVLDKSRGLQKGLDVVLNGTFQDKSSWGATPFGLDAFSVAAGIATVVASSASGVTQNIPTEAGKWYVLSLSMKSGGSQLSARAVNNAFNGTVLGETAAVSSTVDFVTASVMFRATSTQTAIYLRNASAGTGYYKDVSVREVLGNHAYQATSAARPILRDAPRRIDFDAVDDKLITNLPAQLTGCTVIRSVPNVGTQILTGQTIPATYEDNKDHCGLIVINRALTPSETSAITAEFNKRAGV